MADNVAVTAGTGTTIAADEVADGTLGTVKVQYVKIMDGTLDGTTKLAVGSNGIKVDPSGVSSPVNLQLAGTAVTAGAGATAAGTPRITLASDSPGIITTGTAGAASATVLTVQGVALMTPVLAIGAARLNKGSQKTSISASTSETTIVTAIASTFADLYGLILANTGATTTKVDIRNTTGGSIIATIEVPTLETRGFMLPVDSALAQTTVNTNWTAQCAASTTAMEVTALYAKN